MKSLESQLVQEWHPVKNGTSVPADFSVGSGKKVWWLCGKGHEWEAIILNRSKGQGCPYCAGKRVLAGFNDLTTTHPSLAAEWHPTKNLPLKPEEVSYGMRKKVWWLGACSHEWQADLANRSVAGNGCPYCAGKAVLPGFNDLATTHPKLAEEWDLVKNKTSPDAISAGYSKKIWWVCDKNHRYEATVNNRVQGDGCSYCSNHKVLVGFNDLATTNPELVEEWSGKNQTLPTEVTYGSKKKVLWECSVGHIWEASISSRSKGSGCPYCSSRKPEVGVNDLATTHSHLMPEIHPSKNKDLDVTELSAGSNRKIWWICREGHEWEDAVSHRTSNRNCPYCSNHRVLVGFNDLATTHPDLVAQWHPTKNGTLTPEQVTAGSDTVIWWQDEHGHEWETWAYVRKAGHGCPVCWSAKVTSKAETEIKELLQSLGLNVETTNRSVLGGKELDLYLPDHNFGIEFNGLYWHSEMMGKHRTYHYDKWVACKKQGIQLFQIWEDDWNKKKEIVVRALAHKLGVTKELHELLPHYDVGLAKVFARETEHSDLSTKQAQAFLESNHIQGFASGSYYLGLEDSRGILRAVMVLKNEQNNVLNIVRYATTGTVVGGFTKLLKHAERTYAPGKFITFADHCVSDGGLYEKNGFVAEKELPPDYMYVVNGQRKHKFGYRLKRFKDDPTLEYKEGLTERELTALNGLPRIWDAGKTRYVLSC